LHALQVTAVLFSLCAAMYFSLLDDFTKELRRQLLPAQIVKKRFRFLSVRKTPLGERKSVAIREKTRMRKPKYPEKEREEALFFHLSYSSRHPDFSGAAHHAVRKSRTSRDATTLRAASSFLPAPLCIAGRIFPADVHIRLCVLIDFQKCRPTTFDRLSGGADSLRGSSRP
jgi:hypothetical protein